jgi:hypothetical protein
MPQSRLERIDDQLSELTLEELEELAQSVALEISWRRKQLRGESSRPTYQQEYVRCGKDRCQRCSEGAEGHGPYWYKYWRDQGKQRKKYLGRELVDEDYRLPARAEGEA